MHFSEECTALVKRFEGCKLSSYKCPAGVWTIGYGHTGSVNGRPIVSGMTITQAVADSLLKTDLTRFENHVKTYDAKYHWNQNEFDALVSFAFNVGSITQLTANGTRTKAQIALKIPSYNKAAGTVLPGLTKRRQAERELFVKPVKSKEPMKAGEDEMVEESKVIVNGKEIKVSRILKDGTNFVKIRDIATALNMNISSNGNIAVLTSK